MSRHFLRIVGLEKNHAPRRAQRKSRQSGTLRMESLESRHMFAADVRLITELNNNLANSTWGTVGADLLRGAPAAYADGIDDPNGANRKSARDISNLVVAQAEDTPLNDRDLSAFIYAWGQFIDHDVDLMPNGADAFNVPITPGDPAFDPKSTGKQVIPMTRSTFDTTTGTSTTNPRQQINSITAFVDGSMVYGSDDARARALRTLKGGKLLTSAGNLLPFNSLGLANDNPLGADPKTLFVAGDVRANENTELTSLHTLFLREHNRLAELFAAQHPDWTDEQLYQAARQIVIGEIQAITYNEFLPALLGQNFLTQYKGYDPTVNPGVSNEFASAAFRIGHSLVGDDVEFLDNQGNEVADTVEMRDNFFSPQIVEENGIDPILKYLASDRAQELDVHVVDDLRDFLFGAPGQGGLDLASLNIQRGREHGLSDYNATRVAYGLPAVKTFADITSDVPTQNALKAAYGNVNNIDLWVGGLAENHVRGGSVGPLFARIIADQFQRLRDGDRFWYQQSLSGGELALVNNTSLADVIRRNTTTTNLQANVFFFHASISGRVLADNSRFNFRDFGSLGLSGVTVQLLDAEGTVLSTTRTGRDGSYTFDELDLGAYRVSITLPRRLSNLLPKPIDVTLTRGADIRGINFTVRSLRGILFNSPTDWADDTTNCDPGSLSSTTKPLGGRV